MITCTLCGADYGQQRMFCGKCGHVMGIRCSSCGSANPQRDSFCGDCGQALSSPSSPKSQPSITEKTPQTMYDDLKDDVRNDRQTLTHLGPTLGQESINDIFHSDEVTS